MPATRKAFNHVGFSPEQALAVQNLTAATLHSLVTAGFTRRQAVLLKTKRYVAVTNTGGFTLKLLIRVGKFTKSQAKLLLVA